MIIYSCSSEAEQIEISSDKFYDWNGRTGRRHRQEILEYLDVKPFDEQAEITFRQWLLDTVFPQKPDNNHHDEFVVDRNFTLDGILGLKS